MKARSRLSQVRSTEDSWHQRPLTAVCAALMATPTASRIRRRATTRSTGTGRLPRPWLRPPQGSLPLVESRSGRAWLYNGPGAQSSDDRPRGGSGYAARSIVVTTLVIDGRFGVLENPNWQGGSTGASRPRSVPRHSPEISVTATIDVAPYHSAPVVAGGPARPDAAHHDASDRIDQGAPRGRRRDARRHETEQRAQRRTTSDHQPERQGGRDDLPPVGGVGHLDGLDDVLVEGVRRGDELTHPLVGRQQHAVAGGVLDHHVGEGAPGRVVPAADDDADTARAADAGDAAGEALADATRPHSCTRPAGSTPSAASPRATPARSSSERFWLSFAFASTEETASSTPTIGRRFLSM